MQRAERHRANGEGKVGELRKCRDRFGGLLGTLPPMPGLLFKMEHEATEPRASSRSISPHGEGFPRACETSLLAQNIVAYRSTSPTCSPCACVACYLASASACVHVVYIRYGYARARVFVCMRDVCTCKQCVYVCMLVHVCGAPQPTTDLQNARSRPHASARPAGALLQ